MNECLYKVSKFWIIIMGKLIKSVVAISLAVIVLQLCVLGFEINRWNEIVGSIFSIVICFLSYFPASIRKNKERWFIGLYSLLLLVDMIFQLVNMILLICFQWKVIQYCVHLNVSVDISEYGGVACNDWWHFGYGEINYRDRSLIVTILLAILTLLRLIQLVFICASFKRRASQPIFFVNTINQYGARRQEVTTQTS